MLIPIIYPKFEMMRGFQGFGGKPRLGFGAYTRQGQRGVSLLMALLFVSLFGAALASIAVYNSHRLREAEAKVAGMEMVEIAKAARLMVRDQLQANPALRDTTDVPDRITIAALIAGGYLPTNFFAGAANRLQGVGANERAYTALGQEIYVIRSNWPVGSDDASAVPTAFVLLRDSQKSTPELMTRAVEVARAENSSITAPLFDNGGGNISSICKGAGRSQSLWDTGCLTIAEYKQLVTAATAPGLTGPERQELQAGSLIIPAWKVTQPDLRALMRFPQPENDGYATMLTNLYMGTPTDNDGTNDYNCTDDVDQVQFTYTETDGTIDTKGSEVCQVRGDVANGANNRFNISGISNMAVKRLIAEPQAADRRGNFDLNNDGVSNAADDEVATIGTTSDDAMAITGNMLLRNNLRVYGGDVKAPVAAGANRPAARLEFTNGTLAVERNAYLYSQTTDHKGVATIGTATAVANKITVSTARRLIVTEMNTSNFTSQATGIEPANPVATQVIQPVINVNKVADINGPLSMDDAVSNINPNPAELITTRLDGNKKTNDNETGATPYNDKTTAQVDMNVTAVTAAGATPSTQVISRTNLHNQRVVVRGNQLEANNTAAVFGTIESTGAAGTSTTDIIVNKGMTFSPPTAANPAGAAITAGTVRGYTGPPATTNKIAVGDVEACVNDLDQVSYGCPLRDYTPPLGMP